ncbi:hypothetical protein QR685DRAFT_450285 [Neurospora intermedia]|uniref:Uncharacterized protein n=1 Tax=Neurospora intermedia TaxID=5142 RepID=A0ABR3D2D6_NEUIN
MADAYIHALNLPLVHGIPDEHVVHPESNIFTFTLFLSTSNETPKGILSHHTSVLSRLLVGRHGIWHDKCFRSSSHSAMRCGTTYGTDGPSLTSCRACGRQGHPGTRSMAE